MKKTEENQDTTDKNAKKEWKIPSFKQIRSQDTHSAKNTNLQNGQEIFLCYGSPS